MKACSLLGLAGLLVFALPCAEAGSITFSGVITEATFTNNNPGLTIFPNLPAVGDPFTGSVGFTVSLPLNSVAMSITSTNNWWTGAHGTYVVTTANTIETAGDLNGRQIYIYLEDVIGQGNWIGHFQAADFGTADALTLVRGAVTATSLSSSVPDTGSTALLLGLSLVGLAVHRRRRMVEAAPGRA